MYFFIKTKSAVSITDYLIKTNSFDPEYCKSLLQRSLKKKGDIVVESISGYEIFPAQKQCMLMVRSHFGFIEKAIATLDTALDELVKLYEDFISLLCTIPGVEHQSAITIISDIGTDISQFSNSKRLCCWAGLTPENNESAGKKKSVRITRVVSTSNPHWCELLMRPVIEGFSLLQTNMNAFPKEGAKNEPLSLTIARMILTAVFYMLQNGKVWNPTDLFKVDMPPALQEKQKQKAIQNAIKLLVGEGVIQPPESPAA